MKLMPSNNNESIASLRGFLLFSRETRLLINQESSTIQVLTASMYECYLPQSVPALRNHISMLLIFL
uniref:Uncharacterized protein n=1 Tax=Arundo donax TaxID=35708 RepID=A0A0A8Z063_ARUDO